MLQKHSISLEICLSVVLVYLFEHRQRGTHVPGLQYLFHQEKIWSLHRLKCKQRGSKHQPPTANKNTDNTKSPVPVLRLSLQLHSVPISEQWSSGFSQQYGMAPESIHKHRDLPVPGHRFQLFWAKGMLQFAVSLEKELCEYTGAQGFSVNSRIINKCPHLAMFIPEYWFILSNRTGLSCHCTPPHFSIAYLSTSQDSMVTECNCESPTAPATSRPSPSLF